MKRTMGMLCGALVLGAGLAGAATLEENFAAPPKANRPETWFHIIGGNVTREGLTADLEALAGAGMQGIQFFHGQFGGPWPNVPKQIACLSPEWDSLVGFTADECRRLGLTFKMQNCPGWSMSGGPWITPDKAMRRLVYARTDAVAQGGRLRLKTQPAVDPANRNLDYRDIAVLAFPTPEGDVEQELKPAKVEGTGLVRTFTFAQPVTIRTLALPSPEAFNHAFSCEIDTHVVFEALDAAGGARVVRAADLPQGAWQDGEPLSFACEETTAKTWRLTLTSKHSINLRWVRFYSKARFENWEGRGAWTQRGLGWEINPRQNPATRVKSGTILDLTGQLAADGTLDVAVPHEGAWTVLRFGHRNLGTRNGPAPREGTGWECDKLDPKGAETQYANYVGRLAKGVLKGGKIKGLLMDSWECGRSTWTARMEEYFRKANAYELRRHLPSLFGWVIDTPAATDKFLLDWRNTVSDLYVNNFYRRMAELAHADGLEIQFETAFGDCLPGDLLKFWKYADTPMCEFWSPHRNENGHVGSHNFKPLMPCVSAAHLYGKTRVAAEAFTSFELTWNEDFNLLKNVVNRHFARGLTHCVFHTYTHNPQVNWKKPGSSFGAHIGTPFLRGQTWWPYMADFTTWLARNNVMLEAGLPCVDILRYLGDYVGHKPSEHFEPFGNRFKVDYLNPDGLATRVSVKDGRWCYPNGISYAVLWIPTGTFVSPASAAKIAAFEKQGGRVVRGDDPTKGLVPDVSTGDIFWYHRADGARDWYFVAAKENGFKGAVTFRATGAVTLWDPQTGATRPAARTGNAVQLDLAANEVVYVIFDRAVAQAPVPAAERTAQAKVGDWTLALGTAPAKPLAEFEAWRDLPGRSAEERAFSGTGTYCTTVTVAETGACTLDLGEVLAWATVYVNGRKVQTLWCVPYRCEIGAYLKKGANELRVDVTSTWYNRLVYDAGQPEAKRQTWTISGPGARAGLRPSGLLGPVVLSADPESVKRAKDVVPMDRTTHGRWFAKYGRDGYLMWGGENPANDCVNLPAYIESVTVTRGDGKPGNRTSKDRPRHPLAQLVSDGARKAPGPFCSYYSELHGSLTAHVKARGGRPYTVAFYVADCDGGRRALRVQAVDAKTGRRIAPVARVREYEGGVYLIYRADDSIRVTFTCTGGDNAVLRGCFFGDVADAQPRAN